MSAVTESDVENAALEWFRGLGYAVVHGQSIAPGERDEERSGYDKALLEKRVRAALERLNPSLPVGAVDEAFRKLTRISSPRLIDANRALHRFLVDGVGIEYVRPEGSLGYDVVRVLDFEVPENNDWLVVNQFAVTEAGKARRMDVVVFVNGLPFATLELKNVASEQATVWNAFHQLETYKRELPNFFAFNEVLVISDGTDARVGTLSTDKERFAPWKCIDSEELAPATQLRLEVLIKGVFEPSRFLDLIRYFIVFESDGESVTKKMAGYHQFHAVQKAVGATVEASRSDGSRRVGVVWHTQGSGKSLTMAFYAGRVILHPEMQNPTIVVLTDRNDLDDQLYGTFVRCKELLRQSPEQAKDREHLRELLKVASGGVVFTTIQKFLPPASSSDGFTNSEPALSARRNIVVVADEAHRSQYDFLDGFARHMRDALPNASFVGFTGTPVEKADRNTRTVFGNYLSTYDMKRAVEDGATVPIYYESRLAKLALREEERPRLDEAFEEVTEGEEERGKDKLKAKWTALEALVGTDHRVHLVAHDMVHHFETRLESMDGKAMAVCMSRRICVELYNAIVALRPDWHDEHDDRGAVKVVMTGAASDPIEYQPHVRSKPRRELLAKRFKDPKDPLKLVIVRDMWLTGFDAPCMHTLYIDKPMQGHGLMQAIARVNRVFRDKRGGLVVDYLGLSEALQRAIQTYTESGGQGDATVAFEAAVKEMLERFEVCAALFHGFDRSGWKSNDPTQRLAVLPAAQEHVLAQENGRDRFIQAVSALSKAFALAGSHEEARRIRDDVEFFQIVCTAMTKRTPTGRPPPGSADLAIRQIISGAVAVEGVVDIFASAGVKKPNLSVLSEEFLNDIRENPTPHVAAELLRKLLSDEVKKRSKTNVVQAKSFSELLERAVRRYQNRATETAEVIEDLVNLANELREADKRNAELGLSPEELAFYDALRTNEAATSQLGDESLRTLAQELVEIVKRNITIDWNLRSSTRANLSIVIKRALRQRGYPSEGVKAAVELILQQAERSSDRAIEECSTG
jgi:type I restriction enzyme R subunit